MKFTIKLLEKPYLAMLYAKRTVSLVLPTTYTEEGKYFEQLKPDTYYSVEIKPVSDKKTLSQNAYMWELCSLLGQGKRPLMKSEDVYRQMIRDFNTHYIIKVSNLAREKFESDWASKGKGWFTEAITEDEFDTELICYYGSSVWDKQQMMDFIDLLIDECKAQEIPIERQY